MRNLSFNRVPVNIIRSLLPISDNIITIRTMINEDAIAYATGTKDILVRCFAHLPFDHYTPQQVKDMIVGVIEEGLISGKLAILTIADTKNSAFIGSLVLFDITADDAEVGYWILPDYRGKKFSARALVLACQLASKMGLKTLRARTVENNPASKYILLSTGFNQTGEVQPEILPSGETKTCLHYLIDL